MEIRDLGGEHPDKNVDRNLDLSQNQLPSHPKESFISQLSLYGKIDKRSAHEVFDKVVGAISDLIICSGRLTIHGLGTFYLKLQDERIAINPFTREPMIIEPHIRMGFTAGSTLRLVAAGKIDEEKIDLARRFVDRPFRIELYGPNYDGRRVVLCEAMEKSKANESDLIGLLSCCGFGSRRNAERAFDLFKTIIFAELAEGREVRLSGLGKFSLVKRRASTRINPKTNKTLQISEGKRAKFSVSKKMREGIQAWDPE